jgi:hypothetical protein
LLGDENRCQLASESENELKKNEVQWHRSRLIEMATEIMKPIDLPPDQVPSPKKKAFFKESDIIYGVDVSIPAQSCSSINMRAKEG